MVASLKSFLTRMAGIEKMNSESVEIKAGRVLREYYQIEELHKEHRREDKTSTRVLKFSSGYVHHSLVRKVS